MKYYYYPRCSVCKFEANVEIEKGRISEPTLCTHCNVNHTFFMVHNRCTFKDKQMIKLQESPDDMPPGRYNAPYLDYLAPFLGMEKQKYVFLIFGNIFFLGQVTSKVIRR